MELPKLVTISEELLKQMQFFVGSMPLNEANRIIKRVNDESWELKQPELKEEVKEGEEAQAKMIVIELALLDNLAGFLRLLPLYMVGELYSMVQMGVIAYESEKAENKNTESEPAKTKKVKLTPKK